MHYYRSEVNRGVYWNFRRGLEFSAGEYFMWLAHDDGLTPEFLERCVAALDAEPEAVLAYTKAIDIDEHGNQLELKEQVLNAESSESSRALPPDESSGAQLRIYFRTDAGKRLETRPGVPRLG